MFRLDSIRLEDQSNDNWLLTTSVLIKNSGESWIDVFYKEQYRLLIDNSRRPPAKMSDSFRLYSDTETSGEVTFVVPETGRRVGFRIGYSDDEYTTIPIDLKSGVQRSDVQPPGIPRPLSIACMDNINEGSSTYDFRAVTLEPYNVESFLLRISLRITTNSAFNFYGDNIFRLVVENLPYAPIKATVKRINAQTYADAEIVFIGPKSASQVLLRVHDGNKWRTVPMI